MISPNMIPTFYRQYERCIVKAMVNDFIKERLLAYNFDKESLELSMGVYVKARKAEKAFNLEIAKSNPPRRRYEQAMKKAYYSFNKHKDFINLVLSFTPDVRIALDLLDQADLRRPEQWFVFALSVYQKVLLDSSILDQLSAFNITVEQLRQGRVNVQIAREAYQKLISTIPAAKKLLANRDNLILQLQQIMFEFEVICIYAFEDKPDIIAELGLPIMHSMQTPNQAKAIPETLKKAKKEKDLCL